MIYHFKGIPMLFTKQYIAFENSHTWITYMKVPLKLYLKQIISTVLTLPIFDPFTSVLICVILKFTYILSQQLWRGFDSKEEIHWVYSVMVSFLSSGIFMNTSLHLEVTFMDVWISIRILFKGWKPLWIRSYKFIFVKAKTKPLSTC